MSEIRRGDIFWINLDPTLGSEIKKTRPCVVISNDISNKFSTLVTIIPVTTQKSDKIFPHEVLLSSVENLKNSKVKANQIRTVDKRRIGKKISSLSSLLMKRIDRALLIHLDLPSEDL